MGFWMEAKEERALPLAFERIHGEASSKGAVTVFITNVVLVGLQRPLQRDRQLLVDLVDGRLNFNLDASLGGLDAILWQRGTDVRELRRRDNNNNNNIDKNNMEKMKK